ncbi:hypothetical protein IT568_07000 [bacterium]|nr:hypothetical protein [bacterium]
MLNEYVYKNKNQSFNQLAKILGTILIWVFTLLLLFILRQESGSFEKIEFEWYARIVFGIIFCGEFYVIFRSFWRFRDTKHDIFINEKLIGFDKISEVTFTRFDKKIETVCSYLIKLKSSKVFSAEFKRTVHFAEDCFTLTKAFLEKKFNKFEVRYKELIL